MGTMVSKGISPADDEIFWGSPFCPITFNPDCRVLVSWIKRLIFAKHSLTTYQSNICPWDFWNERVISTNDMYTIRALSLNLKYFLNGLSNAQKTNHSRCGISMSPFSTAWWCLAGLSGLSYAFGTVLSTDVDFAVNKEIVFNGCGESKKRKTNARSIFHFNPICFWATVFW